MKTVSMDLKEYNSDLAFAKMQGFNSAFSLLVKVSRLVKKGDKTGAVEFIWGELEDTGQINDVLKMFDLEETAKEMGK